MATLIVLTGMSGSGKTTLGTQLTQYYSDHGIPIQHLDGDVLRANAKNTLGFKREDRKQQLLKTGAIAVSYLNEGIHVIASLIAPYHEDRMQLKTMIIDQGHQFQLIHIDCPIAICIQRDPKGLYKKVKQGKIQDFTGIDAPYESPTNPDLYIPTHLLSIQESVIQMITYSIPLLRCNPEVSED